MSRIDLERIREWADAKDPQASSAARAMPTIPDRMVLALRIWILQLGHQRAHGYASKFPAIDGREKIFDTALRSVSSHRADV